MIAKDLQDVRRNIVCERCSNGTASAQIVASSQPKTTTSLFSKLFLQLYDKPIHSTTTLIQKLHSAIITPQSASHSTIQPSDTILAHSQTAILPSSVPSTSTKDPDPSNEQRDWSTDFNNKVAKELDVEMIHLLSHGHRISCVKFSPDGKYLAAGCWDGKAYIYDVETGALTW